MKKLVLACAVLSMTGCATMFDGSTQSLSVTTSNDKFPEKTICTIHNEEGYWTTISGYNTTTIHRDGNTMTIGCDNPYQKGLSTLEPSFSGGYFTVDLLLTPYIIGLLIDAGTNALYTYPSAAFVSMIDKPNVSLPQPKQPEPTIAPAVENNTNNAPKVNLHEQVIDNSKETVIESAEYFIGKKGKCFTLKNGRKISVNKALCE